MTRSIPKVIRVKECPNISLARLFSRADQRIPGIVEDNVQFAEMRVSSLDNARHLASIRYIERQRENSVPKMFLKIGNVR